MNLLKICWSFSGGHFWKTSIDIKTRRDYSSCLCDCLNMSSWISPILSLSKMHRAHFLKPCSPCTQILPAGKCIACQKKYSWGCLFAPLIATYFHFELFPALAHKSHSLSQVSQFLSLCSTLNSPFRLLIDKLNTLNISPFLPWGRFSRTYCILLKTLFTECC